MTSINYETITRNSHFGVSSFAGEMANFPVVAQFPARYVGDFVGFRQVGMSLGAHSVNTRPSGGEGQLPRLRALQVPPVVSIDCQ